MAGRGMDWLGTARQGPLHSGMSGEALWMGVAMSGRAGLGSAWCGLVWYGPLVSETSREAFGMVRFGVVLSGPVRMGQDGRGVAWNGNAGQGVERQGMGLTIQEWSVRRLGWPGSAWQAVAGLGLVG